MDKVIDDSLDWLERDFFRYSGRTQRPEFFARLLFFAALSAGILGTGLYIIAVTSFGGVSFALINNPDFMRSALSLITVYGAIISVSYTLPLFIRRLRDIGILARWYIPIATFLHFQMLFSEAHILWDAVFAAFFAYVALRPSKPRGWHTNRRRRRVERRELKRSNRMMSGRTV